jgi:hypothetical protein
LKAKLEVLNNTQVLFENEGGALASYASKLRDAIVQQLAEKSARWVFLAFHRFLFVV